MKTLTLFALAPAIALGVATPTAAGECPADQVGPNPLANAATAPRDVTDTLIGAVDLGPEINVAGRSLRMRRLVLRPGGVVPMHSHVDRPALILTVSGTVTEYRSNCRVPIEHRAGEVSREAGGISHWWRNNGQTDVVLYSADVLHEGS